MGNLVTRSNNKGKNAKLIRCLILLASLLPLSCAEVQAKAEKETATPAATEEASANAVDKSVIKPLPKPYKAKKINEELTIYELVPTSAKQKWKMELFDLSQSVGDHYHKIQSQVIVVLEGNLELIINSKEKIILKPMQTYFIPPKTVHALKPVGGKTVRFLAVDSPAFEYPIDAYYL